MKGPADAPLYRLEPDRAGEAFQTTGPKLRRDRRDPESAFVMCAVTAAHSANVLDSEGRELVALQMLDQLKRLLDGRRVTVETVLLRDIILPDMLPVDIEARQLADQPSRLTQFVQERELVQGQ